MQLSGAPWALLAEPEHLLGCELFEQLDDGFPGDFIEIPGQLNSHQNLRIGHQGPGDGNSLHLPA